VILSTLLAIILISIVVPIIASQEHKALVFMQHMVTKVRDFREQHQKLAQTIDKTLESEPAEKKRVVDILAKAYSHMQNIDVWDPNKYAEDMPLYLPLVTPLLIWLLCLVFVMVQHSRVGGRAQGVPGPGGGGRCGGMNAFKRGVIPLMLPV